MHFKSKPIFLLSQRISKALDSILSCAQMRYLFWNLPNETTSKIKHDRQYFLGKGTSYIYFSSHLTHANIALKYQTRSTAKRCLSLECLVSKVRAHFLDKYRSTISQWWQAGQQKESENYQGHKKEILMIDPDFTKPWKLMTTCAMTYYMEYIGFVK
jgi:hypothetical protein